MLLLITLQLGSVTKKKSLTNYNLRRSYCRNKYVDIPTQRILIHWIKIRQIGYAVIQYGTVGSNWFV